MKPTQPNAEEVYLAERVRTALARDPAVSKLGIEVAVSGGKVILRGDVATAERKRRIRELVEQLLPEAEVQDEVRIRELEAPRHEILP